MRARDALIEIAVAYEDKNWDLIGMILDDAGYLTPRPLAGNFDPVGKYHPETAKTMGRKITRKVGTQRWLVYQLIRSSEDGLNADEVERILGWGHSSASSTVSGLKKDRWIIVARDEHGKKITRPTQHGHQGEVMIVNPKRPYDAVPVAA